MKYCSKCGWEMQDDEVFCRNCGTKSGATEGPTNTATYYDDTPPKTLNKTMQVILKILLIIAVLSIVWSAGECFVNAFILDNGGTDAVREMFADFPEVLDMLAQLDGTDVAELFEIIFIVAGVFSLIPLCWVLPMRKKILKAMKEGTTLTTGFKICTLIFVNALAGILLLCSSDI